MHRRGDSVWSAQAAQSERRISVLIPEVKYRDIVGLSFEFVEEILLSSTFFGGTVYYAAQGGSNF